MAVHAALPDCVTHEPEYMSSSANNSPVVKHKSEASQVQNQTKTTTKQNYLNQATFAQIKGRFELN